MEEQLSWGHCLHILDREGTQIGTVQERVLTILPRFELYSGETYLGCIHKEFSLLHPKYHIDYNGWQVSGDIFGWDYEISDENDELIASISKELLTFTDTYTIDVPRPENLLPALMVVLLIDADKCDD